MNGFLKSVLPTVLGWYARKHDVRRVRREESTHVVESGDSSTATAHPSATHPTTRSGIYHNPRIVQGVRLYSRSSGTAEPAVAAHRSWALIRDRPADFGRINTRVIMAYYIHRSKRDRTTKTNNTHVRVIHRARPSCRPFIHLRTYRTTHVNFIRIGRGEGRGGGAKPITVMTARCRTAPKNTR